MIDFLLRAAEQAAGRLDDLPCSPNRIAFSIVEAFEDSLPGEAFAGDRDGAGKDQAGSPCPEPADGSPAPDPTWLSAVALLAREARLKPGVRKARMAWQRLSRGWDETQVWDLRCTMPLRLADQLEHLARTAHGWPSGDAYPHFDDWTFALRVAAAGLRRAQTTRTASAALDAWFDLSVTPGVDPELVTFAWDELQRVEAEDIAAAQAAMHWVADNLPHLWD